VKTHFSQLKAYVAAAEKNRYMSPFELQVCTHFHKIEMILAELDNRVSQLIDELTGKTAGNYSLCHGRLNRSHIVHSRYISRFINWEQAYAGHAVYDLLHLLQEEALFYDNHQDQWLSKFSIYNKQNNLEKYELLLLVIHLLDP